MTEENKTIFPGLIIVAVLAVIVRFSHQQLPLGSQKIIGEVVLGMLVGLLIGNFYHLSSSLKSGIKFCFGTLLKLAIVLLGVKISLGQIAAIGGKAVLLVIFLITLALIFTSVVGKWLKIPSKLSALIGVGTAVCGNTAISAFSPAIQAKDEEMSFAIAVNTLLGTLAVFLYPIIGKQLGLSDTFFGFWAGTAVNDTSQVLATGFAYSQGAGEWAATVKLTRNALMGFVIILMTFLYANTSEQEGEEKPSFWKRIQLPFFVVAFLLVALLNTLGVFTWLETNIYSSLLLHTEWITKFFILMALVGVGLNTKFTSMRDIGYKPLLLGFSVAITISVTSFFIIRFTGMG